MRWLVLMVWWALPAAASAQTVPDSTQATRIATGYRRAPATGIDPFRHAVFPHWGVVFTTGALAANNSLNLADIGALDLLRREDRVGLADIMDALSLVPRGEGLFGSSQLESGVHLSIGLGDRFTLGLSGAGRAYGSLAVDEQGLAFFRDGNEIEQDFSLGDSKGALVSTAEVGVHGVYRSGLLSDPYDGFRLVLGFGGRYVRPAVVFIARSAFEDGGALHASRDSIVANLAVEVLSSLPLSGDTVSAWDRLLDRLNGDYGSGSLVVDLLGRIEWPTSGAAVELSLSNLGAGIPVKAVERRIDTLAITTGSLDSLHDILASFSLDLRDSLDISVRLPRILRVGMSAWANSVLQIDVSIFASLGGDVRVPFTADLGTTWRLVRHVPMRAGLVLGGGQGLGYSGGVGVEARNVMLRLSGRSLGGMFRDATGVGGRLEFGLFF